MELIKSSSEIMEYDPNPLKHIELVARNCYKSEDKITDESAPKFVNMLYERGHHAMLEFYPFYFHIHKSLIDKISYINQLPEVNGDFKWYDRDYYFVEASCNLRTAIMLNNYIELLGKIIANRYPNLNGLFKFIIGTGNEDYIQLVDKELVNADLWYLTARFICDRGVTHELVRHRMCSFAQESTRYCNYGKQDHIKFIMPSWIEEEPNSKSLYTKIFDKNISSEESCELQWYDLCESSEESYKELIRLGWTPQQARSVLPNSLKTEIIVQARLSEWKHIFEQRCSPKAHPDMQTLMIPFRKKVCENETYKEYFMK